MSRSTEHSANAGFKGWSKLGAVSAGVALALTLGAPMQAQAQLDMLRNAVGGGNSGGGNTGGLCGLAYTCSLTSGSIGNETGVFKL